jgi:hypothetical protein
MEIWLAWIAAFTCFFKVFVNKIIFFSFTSCHKIKKNPYFCKKTFIMLEERIIKKFTQILASIPTAQQEALATELAKMIPTDENTQVDWSIGSGYDEESQLMKISFSAKVNPSLIQKNLSLLPALALLIGCTPTEQLASIHQTLTLIENGLEKPYTLVLGMMPILPLSDTINIFTFRIHSSPNATLSKQIAEEQAVFN